MGMSLKFEDLRAFYLIFILKKGWLESCWLFAIGFYNKILASQHTKTGISIAFSTS